MNIENVAFEQQESITLKYRLLCRTEKLIILADLQVYLDGKNDTQVPCHGIHTRKNTG